MLSKFYNYRINDYFFVGNDSFCIFFLKFNIIVFLVIRLEDILGWKYILSCRVGVVRIYEFVFFKLLGMLRLFNFSL